LHAVFYPTASTREEGHSYESNGWRDAAERNPPPQMETSHLHASAPQSSFIPAPPRLPGWNEPPKDPEFGRYASRGPDDAFSGYAPQLPFPEMSGIHAALRNASSRDDVLELLLTGARMIALKVALFVVKRGGYLGWLATPEFGDRAALQSVLIPLEETSIFDRAVREDLYLGPIRNDETHAPLLRVMRNPSRDVAVVPVRVSGKTAVIILADDLGDTMLGTRRLEELARAAGEGFARIVRTRR
jgi:hypothetical protein